MAITRRQLTERATALGVEIEFLKDRGGAARARGALHEIIVTAPTGYVLKGIGTHEVIIASHVEDAPIETLYAGALEDMAGGLEPCTDPACEWCHPEE